MSQELSLSEKLPSRHKIRVRVFQAVYAYLVNIEAYQQLKEEYENAGQEMPPHLDKIRDPAHHFELLLEDTYAPLQAHLPESAAFLKELYYGTLENVESYRQLLEPFLKNWRWERIFLVDRCVLLLGLYELLHFIDIPIRVTLNEWIEIGKDFGTIKSSGFINGILDTVRRALQEKEDSILRQKSL
ncbi:MAG: transcription antitermination factor NusB [Bacteroidia bacterium]